MEATTNDSSAACGQSELTEWLGLSAFRPVAWMRKHPDGTLTGEMLTDERIEGCRTTSGAWEPLYTNAAAARALAHSRAVLEHNAELCAANEALRQLAIAIEADTTEPKHRRDWARELLRPNAQSHRTSRASGEGPVD